MVRVFANGPGDQGSISVRVIPKTQKMALDDSLLNTQHKIVRIKGKVVNPGKRVALAPIPWCIIYWKGAFGSPSTTAANITFIFIRSSKVGDINRGCSDGHYIIPWIAPLYHWSLLYNAEY